ncbi:MAG: transglycosylase SLT domain-containing protein [Deltaproteobacteria bacterium]|nr:transglycosylase SLT domain-containing protein [Deltaproteobacteria bacterium]
MKQSFSYLSGYNEKYNKNEIYFKEAYNFYKGGNYKKAAGLFWLYTLKGRLLDGYALYYQGICFVKLKEYRKANYVLFKLAKDYPNFVFYKNSIFYLAVSEKKDGYLYSAIDHFKYIIKHSKSSFVRPYAIFQTAKIYLRLKNYKEARSYLIRLYIRYPYFSRKHYIIKKLKNIPGFNGLYLTKPQKIERARDLYYDAYYVKSLELLHGINGQKAALIKIKDLLMAKSPLFLKDVNKLLRHNGKNKDSSISLRLLYLKVYYYYYDLHEQNKALSLLKHIVKAHGYLSGRGLSIYKLIVWDKVINDLKNGEVIHAREELEPLLSVIRSYGNNAKYLFWYGIILKKLGMTNKASFYFNLVKSASVFSYYGIMSRIETKDPFKLNNHKKLNLKKDFHLFNGALRQNPALNAKFKRLRAFLNLKIYSLANMEVWGIIRQAGKAAKTHKKKLNRAALISLADIMNRSGDYWQLSELAAILLYNDKSLAKSPNFLKLAYPRPYFSYVNMYANHYSVPVNLIYAVMRQESLYNPACYSSASAIGLMQIIPSTGYYIAKRVRCYNFNPPMLYSKNLNIKFGSYYLKTLLNQFNDKKYLAIASYNAGPNAVNYWKTYSFKGDNMLLFIESIPFNQTRNYVKKVLRNYYLYDAIY